MVFSAPARTRTRTAPSGRAGRSTSSTAAEPVLVADDGLHCRATMCDPLGSNSNTQERLELAVLACSGGMRLSIAPRHSKPGGSAFTQGSLRR